MYDSYYFILFNYTIVAISDSFFKYNHKWPNNIYFYFQNIFYFVFLDLEKISVVDINPGKLVLAYLKF